MARLTCPPRPCWIFDNGLGVGFRSTKIRAHRPSSVISYFLIVRLKPQNQQLFCSLISYVTIDRYIHAHGSAPPVDLCSSTHPNLKIFHLQHTAGGPYSVFCPSSSYAFPLRLYCLSQTPIPIGNFVCKDSPVTLRFPVLPYPSGFPPFRDQAGSRCNNGSPGR